MKIAFFDTKKYDVKSFEKHRSHSIDFKFFDTKLSIDTVSL
jgi:D-lactate dehydrogenase